MDAIQHILGVCGDNHSHLDLIDIVLGGGSALYLSTIWYNIKGTYLIGKQYITKTIKKI